MHDAFVVALRKIDTVGKPAAMGGWLHTVLPDVCLMRLRAGRGEILFDEMQPHTRELPSEMSVEEFIDRSSPHRVSAYLGKIGPTP